LCLGMTAIVRDFSRAPPLKAATVLLNRARQARAWARPAGGHWSAQDARVVKPGYYCWRCQGSGTDSPSSTSRRAYEPSSFRTALEKTKTAFGSKADHLDPHVLLSFFGTRRRTLPIAVEQVGRPASSRVVQATWIVPGLSGRLSQTNARTARKDPLRFLRLRASCFRRR
jgi:hypothetical protein